MNEPWPTLLPLRIGIIISPIPVGFTVVLLQSLSGKTKAVAWVSGLTVIRLVRGLVFGLLLSSANTAFETPPSDGLSPVVSMLLLVVAIVMLVEGTRLLFMRKIPMHRSPDGSRRPSR